MTGKEALDNIAITFDEYSYEPTVLGAELNRHFSDIFKYEIEIIKKDLELLESLKCVKSKRTEQEILKDFENMSWEIIKDDEHKLAVKNKITNAQIDLYKDSKSYQCAIDLGFTIVPSFIDFQEHKLLHELFGLWGWLN